MATDSPVEKTADICFQCRNRKVRCDRTIGGCSNCHRLSFTCSLSSGPPLAHDAPPTASTARRCGLDRRRSQRACLQCREKKTKCSNELPSCHRCLQLGIRCEYKPSSRHSQSTSPGQQQLYSHATPDQSSVSQGVDIRAFDHAHTISDSFLKLSKTDIKRYIDAFFEYVAPIPCYGFLHRVSFIHKWHQGRCNPRLLKTICGISARFMPQHPSSHDAGAWIDDAETAILQRLGTPVVSDIEALILIALDHCMSRRFVKTLASSCLAARMAYIMRLNHENTKLSFLAQEGRRRLMWAIFVFDTIYSSGRSELTSCSEGTIHLQLPCRERAFSLDIPSITEPLRPLPDSGPTKTIGTTGFLVRILDIRDRIQRFVQKIVQRQRCLGDSMPEFAGLESELAAVQKALPLSHKFTQKNIFVRAYTPKMTPFIMLHLWWHQCYCHLYRLMVPGLREALPSDESNKLSTDFKIHCQEQCFKHALAAIDVIGSVRELGKDSWITDPALAMCTYHLARIIPRFSRPPFSKLSTEELIEQLQRCADSLEQPAEIYPTTRILRTAIQELSLHDTQLDTRSSSVSRVSSGEGPNPPATSSAIQSRPLAVYSKFSIMDEVQRLEFPSEEDGDGHAPVDDRASLRSAPTSQRIDAGEQATSQARACDSMPATFSDASYTLQLDNSSPGSVYDVSMLGFDFGYGTDALDPFIDYGLHFEQEGDAGQPYSR